MKTNQTHIHEVGNIVSVYQRPIDNKELEGKAKIIALRNTAHYYDVEFLNELGTIFSRFIY